MPPFVLLRHETPPEGARPSHFDLMLQEGGVLRTWALPRLPEVGQTIQVEALADHRIQYLDYEGPISGGRGSVCRWDRGEYHVESRDENVWVLRVEGQRFVGRVRLVRDASEDQRWTLSLLAD